MIDSARKIAGRYQVIKQIGKGGTSTVYLVYDYHLRKNFAIKEILKSDFINPSGAVGSLIAEANIMNRLNHPLLPHIIDVIDNNKYVYVVMDYIEGTSLAQVVERSGRIPEKYVIHWFKQLCEALTYLHTANPPIIFRDMKPSNIIMTADGSIRLIDFGAATEFKKTIAKQGEGGWGTMGYAAPEQVMMNGVVDARSDIYSLGVTMHYLLTGSDPECVTNSLAPIRQFDPRLSPELEAVIAKCVQADPNKRYRNCRELYYDLAKLTYEQSRPPKKTQSHTLTIVSVTITAVIFFLGIMVFFLASLGGTNMNIFVFPRLCEAAIDSLQYFLIL